MITECVLINRHFADLNPLFFGYEQCAKGHSFGPYVRKYTLIHYVVSGTGRIFKQGHEYIASAGEAFLIHPDEIVTYTADAEDPWCYQWIAFDGALSAHFSELPTVIAFPSSFMKKVLATEHSTLPEYRVASLLFSLYAELFEEKKTKNDYVRRVKDIVQALYIQPLRVEQIAERLNLDRRYLSRIFKQQTGQTVQEYLISTRIEEATRLLKQGMSVEESAHLCGYEDVFNFSKAFKKRMGVSPLQIKMKK